MMYLLERKTKICINLFYFSDKPTAPGAPLDVYDIFKDKCMLSWNKPKDDGGCPIKHYVVEKMDTSRGEWVEVEKSTELKCKVPGLQANKRYQFRVKAVNSEGASLPLTSDGEIVAKDPWSKSVKLTINLYLNVIF